MKSVSAQYQLSMVQSLRERSYCEVIFNNSPDVDVSFSGTGGASIADMSTVGDYSAHYDDTIATLELNRWVLDGSQTVYSGSGTHETNYISEELSGGDGSFSSTPSLTATLASTTNLPGISLTFDTAANEWPIEAVVTQNDSSSSAITIHPYSAHYSNNSEYSGVTALTISPTAMLPYRRFRVNGVALGLLKIFTNADIVDVTKNDSIDPISRRLPDQTVDVAILDYKGVYDPENPVGITKYLIEKSPVSVRFGYDVNGTGKDIEWLQADKYNLASMPTWENGIMHLTATKRLGIMLDLYKRGNHGENLPFDGSLPKLKNLYNMAQDVLNDAGLDSTEYSIDEELQNIASTGIMPICTHAEAIQLIAHAGCCRLYCDADDRVVLEYIPIADYAGRKLENYICDNSTISEKSLHLDKTELCKSVAVNYYGASPVNLLETVIEQGNLDDYGVPVANQYRIRTKDYIAVTPGVYTLKVTASQTLWCWVCIYDSSMTYIASESSTNWVQSNTVNFTVLTGQYVKFCWRTQAGSDIMTPSNITNAIMYGTTEQIRSAPYSEIVNQAVFETDEPMGAYAFLPSGAGMTPNPYLYARYARFLFAPRLDDPIISVYAMPVIEGIIGSSSTTLNSSGADDVEDNCIITDSDMAAAVMDQVAAYLALRDTYSLDYRGNPELDVGDVIGLQTRYVANRTVVILEHEIYFNGALHGHMVAKGL